jgi:glycosyltransferase involved in cell wall biosynthesis
MSSLPDGKPIRRVLVVAYVFPPAGGAGVQRVTKFVKYLPEFGWDCSVLTVANPSVPVFDATLAEDVPESTVVRQAKTLEPGYAFKNAVSAGTTRGIGSGGGANSTKLTGGIRKLLKSAVRAAGNAILQPDAQILWYLGAVKEGLQLLSELEHDAIFVTAPPFSSLVTGAALSRRSGLPLIVDYRDEWGISNQFQENRQKSSLFHGLQDRMQRKVLRQASAAIATTRRSADAIRESVQRAGGNASVSCIYNGYAAADLASLTSTHDGIEAAATPELTAEANNAAGNPANRKLRIAYVGTLWNLTSIEPVVEAIQSLAAVSPGKAERIDLVVAGRRTGAQDEILDRLEPLPCHVIREGYVEHKRAIAIMNDADVQCLLLSDVPGAGRVVPAKTFEYMALGHRILSVGPAGEVREILADFPQAASFAPSDTAGIADYLSRFFDEPPTAVAAELSPSPARFERRTLTAELADVLNQACGAHTDGPPAHVVDEQPETAGASA